MQNPHRRLIPLETRRLAFMSLQRVAEAVGSPGQFQTYLDKIQVEQRRIFEELLLVGSKLSPYVSQTCLTIFSNRLPSPRWATA